MLLSGKVDRPSILRMGNAARAAPVRSAAPLPSLSIVDPSHWRRSGVLKDIDIQFCNAGAVLFGVADYVPALMEYVRAYGIGLNFGETLTAVERIGMHRVSHLALLAFVAVTGMHALTAWFTDEGVVTFALFQAATAAARPSARGSCASKSPLSAFTVATARDISGHRRKRSKVGAVFLPCSANTTATRTL